MIALLESDLNEEKEKNQELTAEIEKNASKLTDLIKVERKLKSKEEELEALKL
jgi:hypothetical protein